MMFQRRDFFRFTASLLASTQAFSISPAGAEARSLTLKTLDGGSESVDSAALAELKGALSGELLKPEPRPNMTP